MIIVYATTLGFVAILFFCIGYFVGVNYDIESEWDSGYFEGFADGQLAAQEIGKESKNIVEKIMR